MSATAILVHSLASILLAQTAPEVGPTPPRKDAQKEEQKKASPPGNRRERNARRDRVANATPEERRRSQVDQMVDRASRTYELNEDQKATARSEIEKMQRDHREAMGPDAEEYDKLRDQMAQAWRIPERSDEKAGDRESRREQRRRMMEDPEFRRNRQRLQELEKKYPVDWDEAMRRVEILLPAEQAKKGRERIEERTVRRQERGRRWRAGPEQPTTAARPADSKATAEPRDLSARSPAVPAKIDAQGVPMPMAPHPHSWELHVRSFIVEHDLSTTQQAAATAILKDVRSRAAQIELSFRDKFAVAEKMPDAAARAKRISELNQPIEQLFTELKTRLDGLLTASQRTATPQS